MAVIISVVPEVVIKHSCDSFDDIKINTEGVIAVLYRIIGYIHVIKEKVIRN